MQKHNNVATGTDKPQPISLGEIFAKLQMLQMDNINDLKMGNEGFMKYLNCMEIYGFAMADSAKNEVLKQASSTRAMGIGSLVGGALAIGGVGGSMFCAARATKAGTQAKIAGNANAGANNASGVGRMQGREAAQHPAAGSAASSSARNGARNGPKEIEMEVMGRDDGHPRGQDGVELRNVEKERFLETQKKWENWGNRLVAISTSVGSIGTGAGQISGSVYQTEMGEYTGKKGVEETKKNVSQQSMSAVENYKKTINDCSASNIRVIESGYQAIIASSSMRG